MIKHVVLIILLLFVGISFSQIKPIKKGNLESSSSISNKMGSSSLDSIYNSDEFKVELSEKTTYKDYKIISLEKDTIYVDTTLTIKKDYKFNYIRKDNFELLEFHNQGQTFNKLAYNFDKSSIFPALGANAKHYNYYETDDIKYYQMATPFTELMYRKGLEQGQVLDALITLNLNKRQNISLKYKGLRSLGKYRNSLASHGNMLVTYTYQSKNKKYNIKSHITAQDLFNEESGGLSEKALINFEDVNDDFKDRGRLESNLVNTDNILRGNRYYLNQNYNIISKKDSVSEKFKINIGHIFKYETKHYEFYQNSNTDFFGDSFASIIKDKSHLTELYNQINVNVKSDIILGDLKMFIENYTHHFRFKSITSLENNVVIPQSLDGNTSSIGAYWKTYYKGIGLSAKAATTFSGDLNGNYVNIKASYKKDSLFVLNASLLNNSKSPNYNYILNQSSYKAYNWHNNFKNELTRSLFFELKSDKLLDASAQITQLDNYTYLSDTIAGSQTKPLQFTETINYLKVKASKSISFRRFTLDNTVMYQKVSNGSEVFKVPEIVTRNTIYYSNSIFKKKPMYIQTGVTFKYFTKYYANSYDPLLSEFNLQNKVEIGNYPVFDIFVNAKVRTMRLFLKAEHINTLFSKKQNYYSAPNYPYRDYILRFGVVWNFFI